MGGGSKRAGGAGWGERERERGEEEEEGVEGKGNYS